jgi:hypothetical protein
MTNYIIKSSGEDLSTYTFDLMIQKGKTVYKINPTNDFGNKWILANCCESKIIDDGTGVDVCFGKRKIRLDYGELDELDTLLRMYKLAPENHLNEPIKYISTSAILDVK